METENLEFLQFSFRSGSPPPPRAAAAALTHQHNMPLHAFLHAGFPFSYVMIASAKKLFSVPEHTCGKVTYYILTVHAFFDDLWKASMRVKNDLQELILYP
jgi:hypothetical protein